MILMIVLIVYCYFQLSRRRLRNKTKQQFWSVVKSLDSNLTAHWDVMLDTSTATDVLSHAETFMPGVQKQHPKSERDA
jgi:hypothetical protein